MDGRVKVREHSSAQAFLQASEGYRAADPLQTNLLGSIAEGVVAGRRYASELWLTVHDRRQVVGAALCTAPYNLVAGPMPRPAAVALGDHLRARRQSLPGLSGPERVVTVVAERLGHPLHVRMRDVLRVLGDLHEPPGPEGIGRRASSADLGLVTGWHEHFLREVGLPSPVPDEETMRMWIERLWLWEVGGDAVAMAGHAPVVSTPGGTIGRIGPVYTVPEARRRGIGASITAVVARHLLESGARVMLYADASNPTANGVYERLGFGVVAEHVEADLL